MNLAAHRAKTASLNAEYRPELLRLDRPRDNQRFLTLLTTGQVFLHDEIEAQLMELIRARHPALPSNRRVWVASRAGEAQCSQAGGTVLGSLPSFANASHMKGCQNFVFPLMMT